MHREDNSRPHFKTHPGQTNAPHSAPKGPESLDALAPGSAQQHVLAADTEGVTAALLSSASAAPAGVHTSSKGPGTRRGAGRERLHWGQQTHPACRVF